MDSSSKEGESDTFNCQASNFMLVLVCINYERKDRTARRQIIMEAGTESVCRTYQQAAHLLSKRWTPLIIRILLAGPSHFNIIARQLPGINDRILSARLKELEAEGILQRLVYEEIPVRIQYVLTEKGQALGTVVTAIEDWGQRWLQTP
jgi:DNA-binding HxlR family transcriptional regulator